MNFPFKRRSSLVLILLFSCCWSLYTHHLTVDSHCPSLRSAVASRPGRQEVLEHDPCRKSDALLLLWRFKKSREIFRTLQVWIPRGKRHPSGVTAILRQAGHGQA
ncbi:hypothetical protein OOU_Y34scaffold01053g3 [Pyricularia oryzae Y34]|uniref:Uncharacterized protein n=1 Tax=Pyricularia oryzae (strain Y34) TaxID=1143189 RepID=A0AA97PFJ9_PYRO3|nr:hypothetical protein OOU_Y34scaffold01053g3 [Pyricularia oryzae Y34]